MPRPGKVKSSVPQKSEPEKKCDVEQKKRAGKPKPKQEHKPDFIKPVKREPERKDAVKTLAAAPKPVRKPEVNRNKPQKPDNVKKSVSQGKAINKNPKAAPVKKAGTSLNKPRTTTKGEVTKKNSTQKRVPDLISKRISQDLADMEEPSREDLEALEAGEDVEDIELDNKEDEQEEENEVSRPDEDQYAPAVRDTLGAYLNTASSFKLLTPAQEKELSIRIRDGKDAIEELSRYGGHPDDLDAAIWALQSEAAKYRTRQRNALLKRLAVLEDLQDRIESGSEARDAIINHNLRLVVSIAKRFINLGLPFLDLIQEGNIGLMEAADRYDHTLGFRFTTYATWWIKQRIHRGIANQGRIIRLPVHMVEQVNKYKNISRMLEQKLDRKPTDEEVAEKMGVKVDKVRNITQVMQETVSLDMPVGEEEDSFLIDFIADENSSTTACADLSEMRASVAKVLDCLTDREQDVIKRRFGIDYEQPFTLEEIGRVYGVTRERIRQIETKAIRKLRIYAGRKHLKDYLK